MLVRPLLILSAVCLGLALGGGSARWMPRGLGPMNKRGLYSSGVRQFHSRYHRSDPSFFIPEYQDLEDDIPVYDQMEPLAEHLVQDKRGKYDDNKAYGFWISALNKAGNYKRGLGAARSFNN